MKNKRTFECFLVLSSRVQRSFFGLLSTMEITHNVEFTK